MKNPRDGVVHIRINNHTELAWTCGCGQLKPGEREGLVKFDTPVKGVHYGLIHESCTTAVLA